MNIRIIGGAVVAAIAAIGVFALGGGDNAVSVSQSVAQTPGTCEAKETRDEKLKCIAVAECFGTDYKVSWEVISNGGLTCVQGADFCVVEKATDPSAPRFRVACETGDVERL